MDYLILKWINDWANRWQSLDIVGIFCADWLIFILPLIIILVYFFSSRRKKFGLIFVQVVLTIILVYLINYLFSLIWLRPRPFVEHREIYQLTEFLASPKDFSFPSDHASIAFVMAIVVFFSWRKFGAILLVLAVLIGLARIFTGVHWPSDVLAGIAVAGISTFLIKFIFLKFVNGKP